MRNFRNARKLQTESMGEADVLDIIEPVEESAAANIGEVDSDDQQVLAMLGEGEELVADTQLVEELEEQVGEVVESGEDITDAHAETLELVTESFTAHWFIDAPTRKMKFESFRGTDYRGRTKLVHEGLGETAKGAWNTFWEWVEGIIDSLKDTWKKYFGAGKAYQSFYDKQIPMVDKLGAVKADAKVKVGYQKHFTIDGKFDLAESLSLVTNMPSAAKKLVDWANKRCEASTELVKVSFSVEEGRIFDSVKRSIDGLAEGKDAAFGKKINRKLAPLGPKGSGEEQSIYALPGNSYIQQSDWMEDLGAEKDTPLKIKMSALRFISDAGAVSEPGESEKTEDPIAAAKIKEVLLKLKPIADALSKIETEHGKIRESLKKLMEESKSKASKPDSDDKAANKAAKKAAKRVSREAVLSARHSVLAVTNVYKTVGAGIIAMTKAHMAAYEKAA